MQPFPKIPNTELFLAGGFVRDTLMGTPPKDRDFVAVTNMTFSEFVSTLEAMPDVKVFQTRPEYFTVRALMSGEAIDLVFPRTETGYLDGRHPTEVGKIGGVTTAAILEADGLRRDFTINAMFMMENGSVLDFFGGKEDIRNKIIRTVGKPSVRFQEDFLRIMRGIRFACKLGFELDPLTDSSMFAYAQKLETIPAERIKDELNQALLHNPLRAFHYLRTYDLFDMLALKGITFEVTQRKR